MNKAVLDHLIGGLILVAVSAAAVWGVALPLWNRSASQAQTDAEVRQQRALSTELSRSLSAAQNRLRIARASLLTFDDPCWTDSDRSRRIERVYRAAHASGMQVEGVEPSDPERIGTRRVLPMRLSARGEFVSVVRTLAEIRNTQPDVVLRSLDITTGPGTEGQLLVNIELLWVPPMVDSSVKPQAPSNVREASVN